MSRTTTNVLFALLAAALAAACGGARHPLVPAVPSDEDGFTAVGDVTPPGMDPTPPRPLALFPGDVVTLRLVSLETTEVEGLSVDERGMLHVPLAGDVEVAGLALVEAEQRIEQALQRYDRTVRATIILTDPQGQVATVIGAVGQQGRIPVVPGMRVADLLAAAGGPSISDDEGGLATLTADLYTARLVRDGEALPISIALAVTGDPRHNVRVRPGDHLYVPPQLGTLVSVLGEVEAARVIAYRPGIRLTQALAMAGGMTRDANGGDIHIVRGPSTNPRVYRAAVDHVIAGNLPDPVLAPGDVVYVGSSALADFRDVIATVTPLISVVATTGVPIAIALGD
jgi:polysaccharide export outer membrane protein